MSRWGTLRMAAALGSILLLVVVLISWPVSSARAAGRSVLIVAPHPDDDLLYGAGIAATALAQGDSVKVVYMPNGDLYGGSAEGQQQIGDKRDRSTE